jgi:uncharacterized protein
VPKRADVAQDHDDAIDAVKTYSFPSRAVGDTFRILIGRCPIDDGMDPVAVYVPDAAMSFGSAVETVRLLQLGGHLPSVLVVGIGYPVAGILPALPLRRRDLAPSVDASRADVPAAAISGADQFLAFIRDELQPWVRAEHTTRAGQDTFVGHSLGGLFGSHVLFQATDTFRHYGLGSPSFWWDDGVAYREEQAFSETHTDLEADVFLSIGGEENPDGAHLARQRMTPADRRAAERGPAPKDMVGDLERMVRTLQQRAYAGLRLGSAVLPGEDHTSSQPINLSRALRFLLQPLAVADRMTRAAAADGRQASAVSPATTP